MELDHMACIDIVQICTVILAPGKLCEPLPLLFHNQGVGGGGDRHSSTLQQTWRKQQRQRNMQKGNSLVNKEAAAQ